MVEKKYPLRNGAGQGSAKYEFEFWIFDVATTLQIGVWPPIPKASALVFTMRAAHSSPPCAAGSSPQVKPAFHPAEGC